MNEPRLAICIPSFDNGGVERMLVNLALGIAGLGRRVDFLVNDPRHPYVAPLHDHVRVIGLPKSERARPALASYLRNEHPAVALASKSADSVTLLAARNDAGVDTRLACRVPTMVSRVLERHWWPRRTWERRRLVALYRTADVLIAVSRGVADDLVRLAGVDPQRLHILPNPVVSAQIARLADAPIEHPWLTDKRVPVVLSIGRFSRAKDFATLIRAFALLIKEQPARLIILGEGRQRAALADLVRRLDLAAHVDLPGFVANPYPYLARADLYALSSRMEGSPNALIEALALGCPVVATDCASGPREILQDGRYGVLVPVGDVPGLAAAMARTLQDPPTRAWLKEGAAGYTVENSARLYGKALGISD